MAKAPKTSPTEVKSDLLSKMMNAGSLSATTLTDSFMFNEKDTTRTAIPIINVAFSGKVDGGYQSGLTLICGDSKMFKTNIILLCLKAYMKKHPDAICLFYDSEFGATKSYISSFGLDASRIIHIPIVHIEALKFDLSKRLEQIERGDKIFIFVDSIGNLASKKEAEDAVKENSAQDMTRAKALSSLFRIITPHLTMKDIPCFMINHIYKEQGAMYPKNIVSGGNKLYLSANDIWIITRAQDKDASSGEINGYYFTINIEKSRLVKEKSKLTFNVDHEKGISPWSGLLDLAVESGHLLKPAKGRYQIPGEETSCLESKIKPAFWKSLIQDQSFREFVQDQYQLTSVDMITEEAFDYDEETGVVYEDAVE